MPDATEAELNRGLTKPVVDRAAALAAGPTRIPRNFVYLVLCAAAALGIGGVLLEHIVSSAGLNPTPTHVTIPGSPTVSSLPTTVHETPLRGPLASFMGLSRLAPDTARPISLVDQLGQQLSLGDERGRVVVLTFFNGKCNDICPVIAAEIGQADTDLGARASHVSFLTVNTDPLSAAVDDLSGAVTRTELGRLPNWHMLTGPLGALDAVWQSYGVVVTVDTSTRAVAHTDIMYFIDPSGQFRFSATPFGNESRSTAAYGLPRSEVSKFAKGIATYAGALTGDR